MFASARSSERHTARARAEAATLIAEGRQMEELALARRPWLRSAPIRSPSGGTEPGSWA